MFISSQNLGCEIADATENYLVLIRRYHSYKRGGDKEGAENAREEATREYQFLYRMGRILTTDDNSEEVAHDLITIGKAAVKRAAFYYQRVTAFERYIQNKSFGYTLQSWKLRRLIQRNKDRQIQKAREILKQFSA